MSGKDNTIKNLSDTIQELTEQLSTVTKKLSSLEEHFNTRLDSIEHTLQENDKTLRLLLVNNLFGETDIAFDDKTDIQVDGDVANGTQMTEKMSASYDDKVKNTLTPSPENSMSDSANEKTILEDDAEIQFKLGVMYSGSKEYADAKQWFEKAANNNYPPAMTWLGLFYENGWGVKKNKKTAKKWYEKSSENNAIAIIAMYDVALWLSSKDSPDASTILSYYQKAADAGHEEAMLRLGLIYDDGEIVTKDDVQAAKWFEKSAEAGNSTGMNNIAYAYRYGSGVQQDYKKAIYWYNKAVDAGNDVSMCNLARMYRDGEGTTQNYKAARKLYRLAVDLGNTDAMVELAGMYREGTGVPKNVSMAVDLYRKAAEAGDSSAMTWLGIFRLDGWGDSSNINKTSAAEWFRKAADAGDRFAMNQFAYMLREGDGIEQNYAEARKWYEEAADLGYADAMTSLGFMYHNGEGCTTDYDKAKEWYEKAVNTDEPDPVAMCNLGYMYEHGEGGYYDYDKAEEYYQQALWHDKADAQDNLDLLEIKNKIFSTVKDILSQQLDVDEDNIDLNDDIWDDLDAQPHDFEIIISEVERTFDIEIDEDDSSEIDTVGELIDCICNLDWE